MPETDFSLWEKEQATNDDGVRAIRHTLDLAQELQFDLVHRPPDFRKSTGLEALKLLNDIPNALKHREFAVHVQHAYLLLHPKTPEERGHTLKYGEMRLRGNIGHYILQRFGIEYVLSLQLFEPTQLYVSNERDRISARLPEPLALPVAGIINSPILIK